jgi:hypothetical protein
MAAFIALTSWEGELSEQFFEQPLPDPATFGLPTADDGSRDDPLQSDRSWASHGLPARRRRAGGGTDPRGGRRR